MNRAVRLTLTLETVSAMRYPRDNVPTRNFEEVIDASLRSAASAEWRTGQSRTLRNGTDATVIVYGALAQNAMAAATELAGDDISVQVIDARFCKPLDSEMLARVLRPGHPVLTVEDHSLQNGFGSAVVEHAVAHGLPTANIVRLGMPDRLIAHATRAQQLAEVGLDTAGIAQSIHDAIQAARPTPAEQPKPTVEVSVRTARTEKALSAK
jgi:1-deoxy-D-xylulose-5-phosphate synthase